MRPSSIRVSWPVQCRMTSKLATSSLARMTKLVILSCQLMPSSLQIVKAVQVEDLLPAFLMKEYSQCISMTWLLLKWILWTMKFLLAFISKSCFCLNNTVFIDNHITNIYKKCFKYHRQLSPMQRYLDFDSSKMIIHAVITSCLDYSLWLT